MLARMRARMSTPAPQLGHRTLFPQLEARVYLAHAAVSPVSTPVRQAVGAVLDDYARLGVGGFPPWIAQRQRLKATLAGLVHCDPADLALVQSTTAGLAAVAACLDWRAGERLLLTAGEFPANVTPWQRAALQFDLQVAWLPQPLPEDPTIWLDALARELRVGGVRLVAVSAVQFQTGLRMPLAAAAELCHRHGAELAVDAVQAFGAVPIDVQSPRLDYLACGAHKWCNSLEGAGFLYVSPLRVARLQPRLAGWLSHEDGIGFLFRGGGLLRHDRPIRQRADFLEIGNLATVSFAALGAATDVLAALGVEAIFAHVQPLLDALESGLGERGFVSLRAADPAHRSCMLCLDPPPGVDLLALHAGLTAAGIATSIPDGHLRLAPHWPNALREVPLVLEAVDAVLAGLAQNSA